MGGGKQYGGSGINERIGGKMDVSSYLVYGVPALAVVIGLVKLAQQTGMPVKFAPALSVGLGIATGIVMAYQNGQSALAGVVAGIVVGLSASGLYDLGKKDSSTSA